MRKTHRIAILVAAAACMGAAVQARDNPSLAAQQQGITRSGAPAGQGALRFSRLHVDVNVHGHLADVKLEAMLANAGDAVDEARFAMELPPDAVVTGYALDVEGRLIDGQLLEQPKARNVYEDEVRRGIDPGLAEMDGENLFRTRVYPVTRDMPRTIRVSFVAPWGGSQGFVLPLQTSQPVGEMTLTAHITGHASAPRLMLGGRALAASKSGRGWSVRHAAQGVALKGALTISGESSAGGMLLSRHHGGGVFFQIRDTAVPATPAATPGRLRVYWDRSLSRRDDLLEREISLLSAYVERVRPEAIDLVTFASDQPRVATHADARALRQAMERIVYRGGTRLSALDGLDLANADHCLLFSDGLMTLDRGAQFDPDCRLSIVSSAPEASGLRLGTLAQAGGGQFLRLTADNGAAILSSLMAPAVAVLSARDASGRRVPFRTLPTAGRGWFVVGELPEEGDVRLRIAGLGNGVTERVYRAAQHVEDADAPAALWASQQVAELAEDPLAHARMTDLARTYQVAGSQMVFLVLESPEQYLRADIRPPAGFSKTWMQAYREQKRLHDAEQADRRNTRFAFVLNEWQRRRAWWGTRFVPSPRQKVEAERARERAQGARRADMPLLALAAPVTAPPPPDAAKQDSLAEVTVTASRVERDVQRKPMRLPAMTGSDEGGAEIGLTVVDALSDQPYRKALDASRPAERLQVLAAQEARFGQLPAFYLETSEWFRLKGDAATAQALLLSALELGSADDETRQIVAFRLQRAGQFDQAIDMLEAIAANTDFRPQPKRALALALAERGRGRGMAGRGDLERAFALLTQVALDPAIEDFRGIETIALMEANSLVPAIEAVGGAWTLDPRLVALLDADVRIVIEWTADDADIDLWVIEPNGEKVFYGDQSSSAGGLISNDMTDGYGPEEYAIRRAPDGEYAVRIDGYSPDRLNPNGNGRVMVRMTRDFGRPSARETLVDADIGFDADDGRHEDGARLVARMTKQGRPISGGSR